MIGKKAGMRTYALVALGSALFVLVPQVAVGLYSWDGNFDPFRVASQIVVGIGFLGAGLIIFQEKENKLSGLTTAAGLWVTAGVGMAAGYGLYFLSSLVTLMVLSIFTIMWKVESRLVNNHELSHPTLGGQ